MCFQIWFIRNPKLPRKHLIEHKFPKEHAYCVCFVVSNLLQIINSKNRYGKLKSTDSSCLSGTSKKYAGDPWESVIHELSLQSLNKFTAMRANILQKKDYQNLRKASEQPHFNSAFWNISQHSCFQTQANLSSHFYKAVVLLTYYVSIFCHNPLIQFYVSFVSSPSCSS